MQIAINISHNLYESIVKNYDLSELGHHELYKAVQNGKPLPEHHGDLIDRNILIEQYGLENATKYGNMNAEEQRYSYSTMMMYEIADMIDDAETIIPAMKEGDEEC